MIRAEDVPNNLTETIQPLIVVLRVDAGNAAGGILCRQRSAAAVIGRIAPAPAGVLTDGVSTDGQFNKRFRAVAPYSHFGILLTILENIKHIGLVICAALFSNAQRAGLDVDQERRSTGRCRVLPTAGGGAILMYERGVLVHIFRPDLDRSRNRNILLGVLAAFKLAFIWRVGDIQRRLCADHLNTIVR